MQCTNVLFFPERSWHANTVGKATLYVILYIHYQFVLQLCEHSHKSAHIFDNIYYNMLLCTHCCIINRVLAFNLHLKFQLANERKFAILQWRPWPMCIIGIGKTVAQRRTLLIPVTSGCNRWSGPIAVYKILSYKCMHGIINWTLISSETNLEEQLHRFPWRQEYKRLILNHREKQGAKGMQHRYDYHTHRRKEMLQSMNEMQKYAVDLMKRCRHHSWWLGHIQLHFSFTDLVRLV